MDNLMTKWYDAAMKRKSIRKFSSPVNRTQFYELREYAAQLCNDKARLTLLAKNGILKKLPFSYGSVDGTNCFAVVIADKANRYMGGYVGEAFVLECTRQGYGTCWIAMSYKKSVLREYIDLSPDETIVAVIAFGLYKHEPISPKKKDVHRLTGLDEQAYNELPEWQRDAAYCASLAPSAMNKQPWEIEFDGDSVKLINTSNNFGYGEVDCGIAMLHIELGAGRCEEYGDWDIVNGTPVFTPND